ncbi:leucine rich repeat protein [Ichthyophthirius multifiliis]|uniref:Dynein regulatory complex subunit 3 n=1 Tax=Ichthyophthirius multifiliis TaxID=5932 RepID=G0R5N1_ICHMU|nr:leucine rich repeat protein [Ichthyophthirius multifiliis]EGR27239.1 leucine rich repeat protein [Ichthyophthirius multifiliis]|eukprot:XP_004024123.1 leucine rich repeat protein [Ichthyophthirius multifiliis]
MAQSVAQYVSNQITTKYNTKDKKNTKNQIDPRVIDENLIIQCVKQFNQENSKIVSENIILQQLRILQLSFKSILYLLILNYKIQQLNKDIAKIQNLDGLEKLEKLQLDNNLIAKIEGIGHLVNLKWLDLSFNLIEKIEGLENLKQLKDLSLFNNRIKKIEGLQKNLLLNVFSVGNNKLASYEEITGYFQYKKANDEGTQERFHFKHLQVLNVLGNPFTRDKENEYKTHIICAIPNLKYLDYVFIDEGDRNLIKQNEENIFAMYQITTTEYEKQMKALEETELEIQRQQRIKKEAKMDILDNLGDQLVNIEELNKVKLIQPLQIQEEIEKFKQKVELAVKDSIQTHVIKNHQEIISNQQKYEQSFRDREIVSEKENLEVLRIFEHQKKIVFRNWEKQQRNNEEKKDDSELKQLIEETKELKNKLLNIEIQLVEELEQAQTDFENFFKDKIQREIDPFFDTGSKKVDDCVLEFYQKLNDIKTYEDKQYHQNLDQQEEEEQDLEESERNSLLENREALNQLIMQIKDTIQENAGQKIQKCQTLISQDQIQYSQQKKARMYERNRKNIKQILQQIKSYEAEILNKIQENESDSDRE